LLTPVRRTGNRHGFDYSALSAEYQPLPSRTPPLPGFDTPYTVRTPRRPGGYAAQVWVAGGYWLVGVHPTIRAARTAGQLFAGLDPVEPGRERWRRDPAAVGALLFLLGCAVRSELLTVWWLASDWWPVRWVRRRAPADDADDGPRWVRRVKGGAYQARYWLEVVGGSLNLGLFTLAEHDNDWRLARWAAARAAKEFRRLWVGERTVGEAVAILQAKTPLPWVPEHVRVPAKWAHLTLPTETGPIGFAHERRERAWRERERRRYGGRTLFDAAA
jgi:hypothetical protein